MKITQKQIVLCKQLLQTFCEMIDSNINKFDEPIYYMKVQKNIIDLIVAINDQQSDDLYEVK
jgi:proteasome assembly chaperone (PAC2) family protein